MHKNGKKYLPRIDRKKGGKKGGDGTSRGSSAAAFARPVGMQDSCSGRFLPWFLKRIYRTPALPAECGGLSSLTRRPPHSTRFLALIYVKKLIRILAVSGRTLAIHGRILPQRMQRRSQKTISINHENSSKNKSQNAKIHQNEQKWRQSKKSSPQDRKRSEKASIIPPFWGPPEHLKSAKVGKKGVSKIDVFFDPLLEATSPYFSSSRDPKSNQNELKIDPGTAKAQFWRECIFYRPCHETTYFLTLRKHPKWIQIG